MQSRSVTIPEGVAPEGVDLRWLGLLSLMANQPPAQPVANAVVAEKKA
jgi:hypothetical protein